MPRQTQTLSREQAARAVAAAIRKADSAVYAVRQREHSTPPRMHQRALQEAREKGVASIREARANLDTAIARERQAAQRETRPSGEDAARITMYATQAMALGQAGMSDLEAGIRQHLAAGNQQAAREFLRAGGSRLQEHLRGQHRGGDFRTLQLASASRLQAERAGLTAGLDRYAEDTARLDGYLRKVEGELGQGELDPDDPDHVRRDVARVVDLWQDTAEDAATEAGVAVVESYSEAAAQTGVFDL